MNCSLDGGVNINMLIKPISKLGAFCVDEEVGILVFNLLMLVYWRFFPNDPFVDDYDTHISNNTPQEKHLWDPFTENCKFVFEVSLSRRFLDWIWD